MTIKESEKLADGLAWHKTGLVQRKDGRYVKIIEDERVCLGYDLAVFAIATTYKENNKQFDIGRFYARIAETTQRIQQGKNTTNREGESCKK